MMWKPRTIIMLEIAMIVGFFCFLPLGSLYERLGEMVGCINMWPRVSETIVNGRTEDGKISVTSYIEVVGALGLLSNVGVIPRAYVTGGGFLHREGKISVVSPTRKAVTFEVPRTGQWYLYVEFVCPSYSEEPPYHHKQKFEVYVSE